MRRYVVTALVAGLILAAGLGLWLEGPGPPVNRNSKVARANYDRIRPGMKRAEVEAILGPAGGSKEDSTQGDPSTQWVVWPVYRQTFVYNGTSDGVESEWSWRNGEAVIRVRFTYWVCSDGPPREEVRSKCEEGLD